MAQDAQWRIFPHSNMDMSWMPTPHCGQHSHGAWLSTRPCRLDASQSDYGERVHLVRIWLAYPSLTVAQPASRIKVTCVTQWVHAPRRLDKSSHRHSYPLQLTHTPNTPPSSPSPSPSISPPSSLSLFASASIFALRQTLQFFLIVLQVLAARASPQT